MRQADLVVATGSQTNVRGAYSSGTPAIGVGAGNVVVIVDETADVADAARKIAASKIFDHATSCSSENSIVVVEAALHADGRGAGRGGRRHARRRRIGAAFERQCSRRRQAVAAFHRAAPRPRSPRRAGLTRAALQRATFLMVEENGVGAEHPFSGEKLSPVLAVYRARDFRVRRPSPPTS